MKYIDLSKLPTSPYSAITNVVALDSNGDIIKAENINIENELTDYTTKEELQNTVNALGEFLELAVPRPQETGTTVTKENGRYVYNGTGTTSIISKIEEQGRGTNSYQLRYNNWGSNDSTLLNFKMATSTAAGMMSADMYNKLMNLNSGDTATKVVWGESSNINSYTTAGVYDITGERRNANDNLPMLNSNPGHTIAARLYVLDSSISGNGASDDKCLTQVLMLSNRIGGDGNLYVRTGRGSSISNISWEQWGTLQQNINVGTITSYDNLIDNGIYSGVFTNGSTIFDTFVMVVINNYAVAGQVGAERTVSQILFVNHIDGTFETKKRTSYQDNNTLKWYAFNPLNLDGCLNNPPIFPNVGEKVGDVCCKYNKYGLNNAILPSYTTEIGNKKNSLLLEFMKTLFDDNTPSNTYFELKATSYQYQNYKNTYLSSLQVMFEIYVYQITQPQRYIKGVINGSDNTYPNNQYLNIIQDITI